MNSVIFLYAAIAIDVGLCVKWHFDDKREAEREQQAELHRKQAAEERLKKTQAHLDELDEEISKSISILGRMMGSVSKGKSAKPKESSDVEPSTGNSAFDDFLKDIFGGGAK